MSTIIQKHLLHAFKKVLQPVVKLLVRAGVQYREFADLSKSVFVECAIREGVGTQTRPTRARIAAVTGIPRRDVDQIVDSDGTFLRETPSIGGAMIEVLQRWHADSRYTGPYGIPLELRFEAEAGERSFSHLVSLIDPSASPQEILDELIRVGSVVYSGEGHLRATSRYFMLSSLGMSSEQLQYFVSALTRFGRTLEFNMDPNQSVKRVERFVVADKGLPVELLSKFEEHTRQQTAAFLLDLDNWLSPHGVIHADDVVRVQTGVHVFMYVEENQQLRPLHQLVYDSTENPTR